MSGELTERLSRWTEQRSELMVAASRTGERELRGGWDIYIYKIRWRLDRMRRKRVIEKSNRKKPKVTEG